jgi:uncharacterized membrane protein YkvA (DUF1232 family)
MDASDTSIQQTLRTSGFIELNQGVWGILTRDFAGGSEAAREIRELVIDLLTHRQAAVPADEISTLVERELPSRRWTREIILSLARTDERFIVSRRGEVLLTAWDSQRLASHDTVAAHSRSVRPDVLGSASGTVADAPGPEEDVQHAQAASADVVDDDELEAVPVVMDLEEALTALADYEPPTEPALATSVHAQVLQLVDTIVAQASEAELVLIEKYIDDKIAFLQSSGTTWMCRLGRTVLALRQLQIREREGLLTLDESALRHLRAGLYYVVNRDDIIKDDIPGVGFLDDAFAVAMCAKRVLSALEPASKNTMATGARSTLDDVETEDFMVAFRQAARECGGRATEDDLLRTANRRLGNVRLGARLRERLKSALTIAIRRKIVERDGVDLVTRTKSITSYERDELLDFLPSVMRKGREYERDEVVDALAKHLGFQRVTENVRETMASVFNSAIRRGVILYRDSVIWRE